MCQFQANCLNASPDPYTSVPCPCVLLFSGKPPLAQNDQVGNFDASLSCSLGRFSSVVCASLQNSHFSWAASATFVMKLEHVLCARHSSRCLRHSGDKTKYCKCNFHLAYIWLVCFKYCLKVFAKFLTPHSHIVTYIDNKSCIDLNSHIDF